MSHFRPPAVINNCQNGGLITVADAGRLGNQMCQYATLMATSKLINATPVISSRMSKILTKVFPSLTIPVLNCSKPLNWTYTNEDELKSLDPSISRGKPSIKSFFKVQEEMDFCCVALFRYLLTYFYPFAIQSSLRKGKREVISFKRNILRSPFLENSSVFPFLKGGHVAIG